MEFEQLLKGLAFFSSQFVSPSEKFCLFNQFCMTSSEGAAWFQAFFALIAIYATYLFSTRAERKSIKGKIVHAQIIIAANFGLVSSTNNALASIKNVYPKPVYIDEYILSALENVLDTLFLHPNSELVEMSEILEEAAIDLADAAGKIRNAKVYLHRIKRLSELDPGEDMSEETKATINSNSIQVFGLIYKASELYADSFNRISEQLGEKYKRPEILLKQKLRWRL